MKREYYFSIACRFWGYLPHELEEREDCDYWIARALKIKSAENKSELIAQDIAEKRRKKK